MNDSKVWFKHIWILLIFLPTNNFSQDLLAFPGAEGFGAYARGGRGGQVLQVTNLNNDGPGSLRWAVEQEGPRTIVFEVSGTIELKDRLNIENPYVTIAGQTAPGDGICLKGATLLIATNDVIVRYLRVRLGDRTHGQGSLQGKDAISISVGEDIIVDHCSASWSLDEVLSSSTRNPNLTRVTVQWCFITEGLNPDGHGFGSLIRGTGGAKYSYLYNLYAHHRARSPRPGNYDSNPHTEDPEGLLLDFRNNVIYNWAGAHAGYNSDSKSVTRLNYVGNYLIPGANSKNNGIAYSTGSPYNQSYFKGNYYNGKQPQDQWSLLTFRESWTEENIRNYKQSQALETGPISRLDAPSAYHKILESGGAILPKRDAVDLRIVNDLRNRTGSIIKSQEYVGGWPILNSLPAPVDTDRDGIPDDWERNNGLNPNDKEDKNKLADDGYTMLEKYLNSLTALTLNDQQEDKTTMGWKGGKDTTALDPVKSGVYKWADQPAKPGKLRGSRKFLEGSSSHFEYLKIHATTQFPGAEPSTAHANEEFEECIIVKEGRMKVTIEGQSRILESGGVVLLMPQQMHSLENVGSTNLSYYVMKYKSKKKMDIARGIASGGSLMLNADSLSFKPGKRGGGKPYFDRPTAMCERFEMHLTQLNNKGPSHKPHAHVETELILVISGETEMTIDGKVYEGSAGDFYFIDSQLLHGVSNATDKPCSYFVYKWN
ncbi:MAG: cupin domain-containing protein [Saprospiraceae bacterium]|nr:cupin domain-containing protein [Saprospiraceae bacterium]